ncbi:MAG: hypothetical protein U0X39_02620 [Bacteroidales bacterium]
MILINDKKLNSSLLITIAFISLLLFLTSETKAQKTREEPPPFRERLFFGGSFSLQLGTITDIEISPVAGVWLLPRIAVAAGPTYRFYKFYDTRTDIFGGRVYTQLVVLRDIDKFIPMGVHTSIFFQLEDEYLSLQSEYWRNITLEPRRFGINTALAGVGLSQQVGKRSSINFTVLWALNDAGYEVYSNPEFRVSFIF